MQIILFLLVAILAYQNNANLNLSKNQVIIVALIAYYFLFMKKEKFALSPTGPTTLSGYTDRGAPGIGPLITDKLQLDGSKSYLVGTLANGKQVFQSKDPVNNGPACVSFPTTVYRLATPAPAECKIGSATGTDINLGHTQAGMLAALDDSFYTFAANQSPTLGSAIPA
jgi:hypothetical protein